MGSLLSHVPIGCTSNHLYLYCLELLFAFFMLRAHSGCTQGVTPRVWEHKPDFAGVSILLTVNTASFENES